MDKRSILGFVVIGLILVIWLFYMNKQQKVDEHKKQEQVQQSDSLQKQPDTNKVIKKDTVPQTQQTLPDSIKMGIYFTKFTKGEDKIIMIETDKYHAEFSTKGGSLIKYEVKGFNTWDGFPVQLLYLNKGGELNMIFTSLDGKMINTKDLYFNSSYKSWEKIILRSDNTYKITYELPVKDSIGSRIIKTYTFRNGTYLFDLDVELQKPITFIANFEYQLVWENSLKLTEYRSDVEGNHAEAFSSMGGELEIVDATKFDEPVKSDLTGTTDWVSSRIKYFCIAIIPSNPKGTGTYITGTRSKLPNEGYEENYSIAVKMQVKSDKMEKYSYRIYLGPVDYSILKNIGAGLEKTMRFSLDFIVRPIAQYAILPFFLFLHNFISNWGLVIIIFSLVMKFILTPFTRYQMKSMKKMSEMQPRMNAIKEKYKGDQQKQQQAMMRFYKEEKINPMGGCLPLLLQLPILYALFGVFNSTIELRQSSFMLWINDLSIPDVIVSLPFKIPLFGIHEISGLALLMGITMFIQQKMTVKDPKQKAMVYMMPIMMTLLFTTLPSGLNLYYFTFNLISIVEQYFVTHRKKSSTDTTPDTKPKLRFKGKK